MKRIDFESFISARDLPDEWWVSVGSEVQDKLMTLDQVADLEYEFPGQIISLMHPSAVDNDNSEWIEFEFEGIERLQGAIGVKNSPSGKASPVEQSDLASCVRRLDKEIVEMRGELRELSDCVKRIDTFLQEYTLLHQIKDELETRKRFIEEGEETLLAKTIRYEEQIAELEQRLHDETAVRSA